MRLLQYYLDYTVVMFMWMALWFCVLCLVLCMGCRPNTTLAKYHLQLGEMINEGNPELN